jgi:hypothetical protein
MPAPLKSKKIIKLAEEILNLMAQGAEEPEIKKALSLDQRRYNLAWRYIQESEYFKKSAISAAQASIMRLMNLRYKCMAEWKTKKDSHPNAAAGYLKTVAAIDERIPEIAQKLNLIEPPKLPEQAHAHRWQDEVAELEGKSDAELAAAYADAVKR